MARRLRPVVVDLELTPREYELRTGVDGPAREQEGLPNLDAIRWDLASSIGRTEGFVFLGERWSGRFTLPRVVGESEIDGDPDPLERIVDLPPLVAAGVRAWSLISVATLEPDDTAVGWRIDTGAGELYWTGAAWAAASTTAHWSTSEELEEGFPSLSPAVRSVTLRARLTTTDPLARPEVYGARVLFEVRDQGDEDDALVRTLIPALRAALGSTAVARFTTTGATTAITQPPAAGYRVSGPPTVFDVTSDPDELSPLPGTWDGTTFTLTTALPVGREVLVEWPTTVRIESSVHRDGLPELLPAIYLFPEASDRSKGQGEILITAAQSGEPVGYQVAAPDLVRLRLEVRVVTGLTADARRLLSELEAWARSHSALVSPETGRIVGVRSVTPIVTTAGQLSAGIVDARGSWELAFESASAGEALAVSYVRQGGVAVSVTDPEE